MHVSRSFGYVLCAAALASLAACSGGGSSAGPNSGSALLPQAQIDSIELAPATARVPKITSVNKLQPQALQNIKIKGTGFGKQAPYNGNTLFIEITDTTTGWSAGYGYDAVNLDVTKWTNTEIDIDAFTGAYGQSGWVLLSGDAIQVQVWNPASGKGPAKKRTVVK